jgi:quercetin dioxygenase-like cupin family protein
MRWSFIIALLIMVTVATGVVGDLPPSVQAQDSTPAAEPQAGAPEDATFRALAAGSIEVLAPSTANVVLGRITLAPGASIPFDPADPSAILVYAASGELTFRVATPMTVARAAGSGTPIPPEAVDANTEFTLRNGDSALFPGAMGGEVRNDGTDEATAWVVDIVHLTEAAATPTP